MTTTKYKATTGHYPRVEVVVIDRESDSSVWIKGRRLAKLNSPESYFETFEEAKTHLIACATDDVNTAKARLEYKTAFLCKVHELVVAV